MKNQLLVVILLSASIIGCSDQREVYHRPMYKQPLVQQCGINPSTGFQECFFVPANQVIAQQPVQQAPVVINNGGSNGAALATGVVLGAALSGNGIGSNTRPAASNKTIIQHNTTIIHRGQTSVTPTPVSPSSIPKIVTPEQSITKPPSYAVQPKTQIPTSINYSMKPVSPIIAKPPISLAKTPSQSYSQPKQTVTYKTTTTTTRSTSSSKR